MQQLLAAFQAGSTCLDTAVLQALKDIDNPRDLDWLSVPKQLVETHADPWQDMQPQSASRKPRSAASHRL